MARGNCSRRIPIKLKNMNRNNIFTLNNRHLAVALLGLLLILVSCHREDLPKTDSENTPIEFSGITAWLDTKSEVASATSVLPSDDFMVWSQNDSNYGVFGTNGTEVSTSDAGTTWTYSPVRYWKTGTYNFYAVSPASKATGALSANGLSLSFGTSGWDLSAGQTDLLIATQTIEGSAQVNKDGGPSKVTLSFDHMLSKISFSARNADPRNVAIAVTDVKVYGNSRTATGVNCKYVDGVLSDTWTLSNTTTSTAPFKNYTHDSDVSLPKTTEYALICPGFMVFPEEECDLAIEVTFSQTFSSITGGSTPATKTATITNATWKPGYVYDYKLTVTAETIAVDNEPAVTPWDDNNGSGYDADAGIEF